MPGLLTSARSGVDSIGFWEVGAWGLHPRNPAPLSPNPRKNLKPWAPGGPKNLHPSRGLRIDPGSHVPTKTRQPGSGGFAKGAWELGVAGFGAKP